jgi:hypothetical protein
MEWAAFLGLMELTNISDMGDLLEIGLSQDGFLKENVWLDIMGMKESLLLISAWWK